MIFSNAYSQTDNLPKLPDFRTSYSKHDPNHARYNYNKDRHSLYKINVNNHEIPITTYSGQAPDEHQLNIVRNVIVDDFLVNDDNIGGEVQRYPCIAMDGNGNFVIVWNDLKNGNWDIYFQRYNNTGIALGLNTKANDDIGTTAQGYPAIAMDDSGNFVIVWDDLRNGNSDIYFQRYNSNGTAIAENTKANDDTGTANQYSPSIDMNRGGNFVIAWMDRRNGNLDIFFQRFNSSGIIQGVNKKANDDTGTKDQMEASVAIDDNSYFVIVWQDSRNENDDIYFQRYSNIGTDLGVNTKVNDDTGTENQWYPSIAMDYSGNFIIAWQDNRNYDWDIYYQRYNIAEGKIGGNKKANNDSGTEWQTNPVIAMDGSSNFVIVWTDERNENDDIYFQHYNSSGTAQGFNTKANNDPGKESQGYASLVLDNSGNFVIAWEDQRLSNLDIYFQSYNKSGSVQGVNTKANDDSKSASQYSPSIAMDDNSNFVIAWNDSRNGNGDIYFQQYNNNGTLKGVNSKVNNDVGNADQIAPTIVMDVNGNFVIVWEDYRNGVSDIYFQRYNSNGAAQGTNTKANIETGDVYQYNPSAAMDNSGNFVIVWEDRRNNNLDIYFQRYNNVGTAQGVNTKANDDSGTALQYIPSITMDGNGNFVVVWYDKRNGNFDIYFQRYNSNGTANGLNTKVNDDNGTALQYSPSIAMDDNGNYVIVWYDFRNANSDIYFQLYNSNGSLRGVNIKANTDAGTTKQNTPSVAMENSGNFVIVWVDYRYGTNNPDIIGQRFFADGSMNEGNYRIVADGPNYGEQLPVVAANSDKITFAWMDNRRSKGWDIYGKIVDWDWDGTTSVSENELRKSKEFELTGNFPNPFFDNTNFEYLLGNKSNIDVSVFDIHGNKVRTLLNESQETGRHSLTWDGKNNNGNNVNKGVYLVRFSSATFQVYTKTILLK